MKEELYHIALDDYEHGVVIRSLNDKKMCIRDRFWGAYDEERLKGVIATNENRKHICCFFVKAQYKRQGIGRKLWNLLRENSSSKTITVNSSPYAVPVYHKLCVIDTDTEQLSDGIRSVSYTHLYKAKPWRPFFGQAA